MNLAEEEGVFVSGFRPEQRFVLPEVTLRRS